MLLGYTSDTTGCIFLRGLQGSFNSVQTYMPIVVLAIRTITYKGDNFISNCWLVPTITVLQSSTMIRSFRGSWYNYEKYRLSDTVITN